MERRLHIRVGPDIYLAVQLRVAADGGGSVEWFGDMQLQETLAMLQSLLPERLPALSDQGSGVTQPEVVRANTLQACLTFVARGFGCLLLCDAAEPRPAGTYRPFSHTLLLHVELHDPSNPRAMRTAPEGAIHPDAQPTIAQFLTST